MKLSEVMKTHIETTDPLGDPWKIGIKVHTTTDANRVLHEQDSFDNYIEQFGDVEVVYDEKYRVYRVPAFKEQRDRYCAAKAESCRRWGSN
jgi:hypothetical protein